MVSSRMLPFISLLSENGRDNGNLGEISIPCLFLLSSLFSYVATVTVDFSAVCFTGTGSDRSGEV